MKKYVCSLILLAACGDDDGAASTTIDAAPVIDATPVIDAAATPALFINEVMASNKTSCADALGGYDDWVELYNAGATDLDLTGYYVTDDAAAPTKAQLPAGVVVPAHGYALLWADGEVQGPDHLSFKLAAEGEAFAIYAPDGTAIDSLTFGAATTDVSFARLPDGTGDFVSCAHPTCGAANGATCAAAAR